jgi:hypothetical protein
MSNASFMIQSDFVDTQSSIIPLSKSESESLLDINRTISEATRTLKWAGEMALSNEAKHHTPGSQRSMSGLFANRRGFRLTEETYRFLDLPHMAENN